MAAKKIKVKQKITKRPDGLFDLVITTTGKQKDVEDATVALAVKATKMGLDNKMSINVSRPKPKSTK